MPGSAYKPRTGLLFLALSVVFCVFGSHLVDAAPQPIPPGMMYREDYGVDIPSQSLVERLKQVVALKEEIMEKEINELEEEQMQIQALIEAKARMQREQQQQQQHPQEFSMEDSEQLPVPAAVYHSGPPHSGKRTSYMALCHFKICNMGRKRQM